MMNRDTFKMIHSELIQQVQCIEFNLKVIYSAMHKGSFEKNMEMVEKENLGRIAYELRELDFSDGVADLSEEEYKTIDDIREIRNYWCHQCYIDFVYIQDDRKREVQFQKIATRLHYDENRTYALFKKTEKIKQYIIDKYR